MEIVHFLRHIQNELIKKDQQQRYKVNLLFVFFLFFNQLRPDRVLAMMAVNNCDWSYWPFVNRIDDRDRAF